MRKDWQERCDRQQKRGGRVSPARRAPVLARASLRLPKTHGIDSGNFVGRSPHSRGVLDRLHEMHRREEAATRAVMKIKDKIRDAGIWVPPSSREHFLAAADFRGWAKSETDPK